jgi:hypothetical protein
MSGYTSESVLLQAAAQVLGASVTKQVVSNVFHFSAEDSLYSVFEITSSGRSGTVTAYLQTSLDGTTWSDTKTVTVNANAVYLKISANDTTNDIDYVPLRPLGRLAVTTAGASGVSVDNIVRSKR